MAITHLTPLVIFVVVATISPGGATTLATASGVNFGFRRSVPLIGGMSIALGCMAAAAAAGLATLLLRAPALQIAMKLIGSTYLLWLSWKTARSGEPNLNKNVGAPIGFSGGVGLLWINPKAWAMTLSAAAAFATLSNSPLKLAVLLGLAFTMASALSLILWCAAGSALARRLRTIAQWRALNIGLGILLIASIIPMWLE